VRKGEGAHGGAVWEPQVFYKNKHTMLSLASAVPEIRELSRTESQTDRTTDITPGFHNASFAYVTTG